jgi:mRNA interferase MazF
MRRGEVWLIYLDPTSGARVQKTRPAVIVNEDAIGILPLRVIVPITDWKERYEIAPWMVRIDPDSENGLHKPSAVDALQIHSVSQSSFSDRIGKVSSAQLQKIVKAIQTVIGA